MKSIRNAAWNFTASLATTTIIVYLAAQGRSGFIALWIMVSLTFWIIKKLNHIEQVHFNELHKEAKAAFRAVFAITASQNIYDLIKSADSPAKVSLRLTEKGHVKIQVGKNAIEILDSGIAYYSSSEAASAKTEQI